MNTRYADALAETLEFASNTEGRAEILDTPVLEAATEIELISINLMARLRMSDSSININDALNRILNLSEAIERQARDVTPPTEEAKL